MRLFVGITLPPDIRLVLGMLCSGISGARWVNTENMHMTLRFIGETDGRGASDLNMALDDIQMPAFNIAFFGIGHFSNKSRLRAIWAGVEANEALLQLQAKVQKAALRAGFKPEGRKFKPHVTLARFRGQQIDLRDYFGANGTFSTAPFSVEAVTLFESHLGRGGAHYVALKDYPLFGKSP